MAQNSPKLLTVHETGVNLVIKAKPGASRARPPRIVPLAGEGIALEIAVSAPPEDGRANKAIIESLAKATGLRKGDISLKTGASARIKTVEILGDPEELKDKISSWLHTLEAK